MEEEVVHVGFTAIWVSHIRPCLIDESFPLNLDHVTHINAHFKFLELSQKFFILLAECLRFKENSRLADLKLAFDLAQLCAVVYASKFSNCCGHFGHSGKPGSFHCECGLVFIVTDISDPERGTIDVLARSMVIW